MEFYAEAKILDIIYYQILVEVYWSIEKIEKYYVTICQVYNIIQVEVNGIISKNSLLQMECKLINNTASPDHLVFILFIFGAYH